MYDIAIIGGGIVGLAAARELGRRRPGHRIVILEQAPTVAAHQSGHNSGVIHSGVYYRPGSFKAKFSAAGNRSMVAFCQANAIPHEVCGKLIVASAADQLPALAQLEERGRENGLRVRRLEPAEARGIEPHVSCVGALHVPSTGIVSYQEVCLRLATLIQEDGAEIRLGAKVESVSRGMAGYEIHTASDSVQTHYLINCAGLQSDRVARLCGLKPPAQIIPFRGEYFELKKDKQHLINGLIYPVPNPDFPFLGVHFTRTIDGTVHAGPNAVLALMREGYNKWDVSLRDSLETVLFPGFWRLMGRSYREGIREVARSFIKLAFTRSLQRLVPEIEAADLVPSSAGVRAQAVGVDGQLIDDFLLVPDRNALHVLNAPSPAATCSLEIAGAICDRLELEALS